MTIKIYLIDLENTEGANLELALNEISDCIPCHIYERLLDFNEGDYMELRITCRPEDVRFIEDMLAPFV